MNKQRLLSFITALVIIASMFVVPSVAYSADKSQEEYDEDVFNFLSSIGVFDSFNKSVYDGEVTRAEFTALCVSAAKIPPSSAILNFDDVKPNHELYQYIASATECGIINSSSQSFAADRIITTNEALKIALSTLGYGAVCEARGGYPYGYVNVADELELLPSSAPGSPIDGNSLIQFLYKFLTTDIMEISSVSGGAFGYSAASGKTLLGTVYGLQKITDIVSTAGMSSIRSVAPDKYCVEADGKSYNTTIANVERYLGLYCDIYVDLRTNTVEGIITAENTVTHINPVEVSYVSDSQLKVYDKNDKEKNYRISPTLSFVRNGRLIPHTPADFSYDSGSLTLIDNNSDGIYDVVISERIEYVLAGTVDIAEKVLYNKLEIENFSFDSADGFHYSGYRYNSSDNSYTPMSFEELESGMFLEIKKSDDGKLMWFCVIDDKISGKITERGTDTISINGTEYETTEYFSQKCSSLQFGLSYEFCLTSDNRIAYAKAVSNKAMQYGYLIGYGKQTGMEPVVMLKMLTLDGSIEVFDLSTEIMLDGIKEKALSENVTNALCENSSVKYQLIRFKCNSEGRITTVDTANTPSGSVIDKYKAPDFSDNSLVRNVTGVTGVMNSGKALSPICTLSGTSLIMVPETLTVGEEYDDSVFRIDSPSALTEHKTYKIDGYDFDSSMSPAVAVVYSESALPKGSVYLEEPLGWYDGCVVDKVTNALTADGEEVTKITVVRGGSYHTYYINQAIKDALINAGKTIPSPGDIIRVTLKNGNYIYGIAIDATYNPTTGKVDVNTFLDDSFSYRTYVAGKAFARGASSVTIFAESSGSGGSVDIVDNLITLGLVGDNIVKFSRSMNQCKPARISDVVCMNEAGEDSAAYICVKTEYGKIRTLVIYTD